MNHARPVGPLTGFTLGVTAHRRADEQIQLLERKGASIIHGPTIETHALGNVDHDGLDQLAEVTRAVIDDPPDWTLLSTGIGVRAWFEAAASFDLADALVDALSQSVVVARGPKAHGAAVTNGLTVSWQTPNGWSTEMVEHLASHGVTGRVAVQLDGATDRPLPGAIAATGAKPIAVPVYEWSMPGDPGPAHRLIEIVLDGRLDGITFTARPQVENLLTMADVMGRADALVAALRDITVVCVGPVCASAITDLGLPDPVQPSVYRLGSMVLAANSHFDKRARSLTLAGIDVRIQGRAVLLPDPVAGGDAILLTDRERLVLEALAEKPGVVWSKDRLLAQVWLERESDTHVVEVTVGRLRQRLGPAGAGIETVFRRGYRLTDR